MPLSQAPDLASVEIEAPDFVRIVAIWLGYDILFGLIDINIRLELHTS